MDIETLRTLALSLPHTTEDVKWGKDLCFCVGKKMFAATRLEQPSFAASFKVTEEEFAKLTERESIIPAPYLARYKWVYVKEEQVLSSKEWEYYIKQSYELVKTKLPKKVLKEMD